MRAFKRLFKFIGMIRKELLLKIAMGLLVSATYITQAFSMADAVTVVFQGGSGRQVLPATLIALTCIILRAALGYFLEGYNKVMAARAKSKIREAAFDKLLHLGPGYLSSQRTGHIQSLVLDGIESLEPFLVHFVPQMITVCISALALGIYLIHLDRIVGIVAMSAVLLCSVVPYLTVPMVRTSIVSYWRGYAALNAQYIDSIQGMPTLLAFHASGTRGAQLAAEAHDFYKKQIRNTSFSLLDSALMLLLTSVAGSVTVAIAAYRTDCGRIPVTLITTFLFLAAECARPMMELNSAWHNSFLGLSTAEDIFRVIDTELTIRESDCPDRTSLDGRLPDISFENVTFRYPGSEQPALQHISLQIGAGQTVAVVGRSGSGKSTMLNLLLRFYDVCAGAVEINGVDVRQYDLAYLRSKVGVVFQDAYLFNDTVLENIRMARPNASYEQIEAAARAAGAHAFISELPNGYNTILGERGVNLSGGERQRISIARAIVKDAPLLILDEATSSVDAKSEALIQKTMETLAKGRTTIVIAHRLSTIQNADVIFVLDQGKLAEYGDHSSLLAADGVYAELVRAQTRGNLHES